MRSSAKPRTRVAQHVDLLAEAVVEARDAGVAGHQPGSLAEYWRRSSPRITLPVAVSGSASRELAPGADRAWRGEARADEVLDRARPARHRPSMPGAGTITAVTRSVRSGSGRPMTAAMRDGRVAQQAILDLARADAVAGRGDDVVVAADEAEVAVLVLRALVAGQQPVAGELGRASPPGCSSSRGTSPGRAGGPRSCRRSPGGSGRAGVVEDRDLVARHRPAHRSRAAPA